MILYIGADHGGYKLKEQLKTLLTERNIEHVDVGFHTLDPADDFPDMALKVSEQVSEDKTARGLLICSTGVGMCIAANKVKDIRAVVLEKEQDVYLARRHNNINVLCIGAFEFSNITEQIGDGEYKTLLDIKKTPRFPKKVLKLIDIFLETEYENKDRLNRRLQKIASYSC